MKQLSDYYDFNIKKFMDDSRHWEREKRKLLDQLDTVTELGGMDYSPIRSGKLNDSTGRTAMKRMKIESQIERIGKYQDVIAVCRKHLSDRENSVIERFYYGHGTMNQRAMLIAKKEHISVRGVYALRNQSLKKLKREILKNFS